MMVINQIKPQLPNSFCDFGYYYGTIGSPLRLAEYTYIVNGVTYPPGMTTLAGGSNITLPTGANVPVSSTATFEAAGSLTFYGSTLNHTTTTFTVVDATHFHVTGGTGTYSPGTPLYDPRFYLDSLPLNLAVIFDATDSNNLGINKTSTPTGVSIVEYQWDFGNGLTGYGPVATTAYDYNIPAPGVEVKLIVIDSLGRMYSRSHHINLVAIQSIYGHALVEHTGTAR